MIPIDDEVFQAIQRENFRSQDLFPNGAMILPNGQFRGVRLAILVEEIGEVAKAINESEPKQAIYTELIQSATMSAAWAHRLRNSDAIEL